jgi:hypothetical protein
MLIIIVVFNVHEKDEFNEIYDYERRDFSLYYDRVGDECDLESF